VLKLNIMGKKQKKEKKLGSSIIKIGKNNQASFVQDYSSDSKSNSNCIGVDFFCKKI